MTIAALVVVACVLGALMLWPRSVAPNAAQFGASRATRVSQAPAGLPAAARGVVQRVLGDSERRFLVRRIARGFRLTDARAGLSAAFTRGGAVVSAGGASWSLGLRAVGRGRNLVAERSASPVAQSNVVRYARLGVQEWYASGPFGLEQGFTLTARPTGSLHAPVTLALGRLPAGLAVQLSSDRRSATVTRAGVGLLRYSGLFVSDARGRSLPAWIEGSGRRLSLQVVDRGARYPLRVDPFVQAGKLTASDGAPGDEMGTSIAVSGDTIVAGAPSATVGANQGQGAVYVFVKPAGGWADANEVAKLTASDGATYDSLGWSVAISPDGSTVIAGAIGQTISQPGAAYVFLKPNGGWTSEHQAAKLTNSAGAGGDRFGFSVALSADTAVVGVPNEGNGIRQNTPGSVYVFAKPPAGWADSGTPTAHLTASDGVVPDAVGYSVAIDGDTIVAGAEHEDIGNNAEQGALYVFVKPANGWADATETKKLTASDGAISNQLGYSVAIAGDTIVAGAPFPSGAAYVFVRPADGWANANGSETAKLTPSDPNDGFGKSVGISGDTIVAGAPNVSVAGQTNQGKVYVFAKPVGGWISGHETQQLLASDGAGGDQLGSSVGVSGGTIAAAAPGASQGTGAGYVFSGAVQAPTTTTVVCQPASVTVGTATTCTATVSGGAGTPTGSVAFSSDSHGTFGNPGSSCTLNGNGSCHVDYTPTGVDSGTHQITGSYGGDGTHQTSSGNFDLSVTAGPMRPTSTSVSCSPSPVAVGQATTCNATVSDTAAGAGTTPTGTVSFSSDSTGNFAFGSSCALTATADPSVATCQVNYTPASVGSDTITAAYGGDASHEPSHGSTALSVTAGGGGGNAGGGTQGGSGGGNGGGSGGGGVGSVFPNFITLGRSPTLHHALRFDARSSVTNGGKIVNFTWRSGGGAGIIAATAPCGVSPIVALTFRKPGVQRITLTATTSAGQSASVTKAVAVPLSAVNALTQPAFDCENPGAGNQIDTPGCVKTFGWGVVQVNSRGGASDCFQLQERSIGQIHLARDAHTGRTLTIGRFTRVFDIHATIHGPIAIDGLYLPLPSTVPSEFDDFHSTIQVGQPIPIEVGSYHLLSVVLNTTVGDPDPHTGLVPLVPNVGLSGSSDKSIGGLPLAGLLDVNLSSFKTPDGYNISKVKIHAKLPAPFPENLPADGYLESDNENGAHITGFQLGPFDTDIVPGFALRKVYFRYIGGTDEVWEGGADVYLPGQVPPADGGSPLPLSPSPLPGINFAPPPPDLGIGFRHGHLDHFGIGLNFVDPFRPVLFPGIDLGNVHFALGLKPLRFTGGIGVAIGKLIGADGDVFVAFASSDQQYQFPNDVATGDLSPLAGRWLDSFTLAIGADAHLDIPAVGSIPLLNAWILYEAPDYFQLAGHFDFSAGFIEIKGDAGGWIWPSMGKFSFGGDINLCVKVNVLGFDVNPCLGNGIVVSSRGVGGCTTILVPTPLPFAPAVPVTISAGYIWGSGFSVHPFTCDLSDYTEDNPRAADHPARDGPHSAAASWPFRLPGGLPSAEVRITGQGGAPDVTLNGPGGRSYSTANPPTDPRQVLMLQYGDTTVIALNHPPAGAWTITPNSGSVPITSVGHAQGLPAPKIKARVTGRGDARVLAYTVAHGIGRVITFIEQGARTYRILGVARGARGRISFTPDDGRAGRRQIVAQVEQNGVHTHTYVVAQFSAPGPHRPPRPARVNVSHRGYTVAATWSRVPGATEYEVMVTASDGGREMQIVRGRSAAIVGIDPGVHGAVLVDAVSADGLRGAAVRKAFSRVAPAHAKRRHR